MTLTHRSISVDDGALPLTFARAGGTGAAVVIMPSAFGVGPDLEAQMSELAEDARAVVALDPFFRDGEGLIPYEDMARVMARVGGLDRTRAYRELSAVLALVRAEEIGAPIVLVGICLGGPFGLVAAADGQVDGVVTWHGSRMEKFVDRAAEIRCPLSLHFGSVDPVTPAAAIDAVRAAFATHADAELFVHDAATHGFSQRRAGAYHATAERAGMDAVKRLVVRR